MSKSSLKPYKSLKKIINKIKHKKEWFDIFDPGMAKHYLAVGEYIKEIQRLDIKPFQFESTYETSYRLRGLAMHILGHFELIYNRKYKKWRSTDRAGHIGSMWHARLGETYLRIAASLQVLSMEEIKDLGVCQR